MNLLIDTNIVIPLEPGSILDVGVNTDVAIELHNLAHRSGNVLCIHPAIEHDLARDEDRKRANIRRKLIGRYKLLPTPPHVSILPINEVGCPPIGTNDHVDNCLLAAVKADAVNFLVTEDLKIHRKAEPLGVRSRMLFLQDAVSLLRDFFDITPPPPPAVKKCFVHELDERDNIFRSLRVDYHPDFDHWLRKCKREHREAYVIRDTGEDRLAGLAILKREDGLPSGKTGKTLKLCTFKVSGRHSGNRYGELLLKASCDYAGTNHYRYMYFTVFPRQESLIAFAQSFGFTVSPKITKRGEHIIEKCLSYSEQDIESLTPLEFHLRFGPRAASFHGNSTFIVPVIPEYHRLLFPELERQLLLLPHPRPCGNSIKKAYLCHSRTTQLQPGDNILIYRSHDLSGVTAMGVVEDTLRSNDPEAIVRYVGSRTVYRYDEIRSLCERPLFALRFRFVKGLDDTILLRELRENRIIKGQPQSISRVPPETVQWIRTRIGM